MADYQLFLEPIVIETGVNDDFVFDDSAGTQTATVAAGTYYLLGDGSAEDLLEALVDALNAASVDTHTNGGMSWDAVYEAVVGERIGTFTITSDDAAFEPLPENGSTTFPVERIGLATDPGIANATQFGTTAPRGVWVPSEPAAESEPEPVREGAQERSMGGVNFDSVRGDERNDHRFRWDQILEGRRIFDRYSNQTYGTWQTFRREVGGAGRFRVYEADPAAGSELIVVTPSVSPLTLFGTFVLDGQSAFGQLTAPRRPEIDLRALEVRLREYVAP